MLVLLSPTLFAPPALAADPAPDGLDPEVIIVTARKREERAATVPLSISVASGRDLLARGIADASQLPRIVPGFTFNTNFYGTPVYSLRGVGFQENSLGATPAVTVYLDEIPIPFAAETAGSGLDIAQVEVIKGPQGTLYGQNATGGLLNYTPARPTDTLESGGNLSFGSFATFDGQAYLSGPIDDTLGLRLAGRMVRGNAWQKSYTRPGDRLGGQDFLEGRALLDWRPSGTLRFTLNLSAWRDRGETPAAQLVAIQSIQDPPNVPFRPGLEDYPPAPADARAADWDAGRDYHRDNRFHLVGLRGRWDVGDTIQLVSITAWEKYRRYQPIDSDGTGFEDYFTINTGSIENFYQELRGDVRLGERGNLIVGANYAWDRVDESITQYLSDSTTREVFGMRLGPTRPNTLSTIRTYAAFASAEVPLARNVTLSGGLRYTDSRRDFRGCGSDTDGSWALISYVIQQVVYGQPGVLVPPGGCATNDPTTGLPGYAVRDLNENNVAWRVALDWRPVDETMIYANVARGYKAGSFPTLAATLTTQFDPVPQESVLAYEAGVKSRLTPQLRLEAAGFYYDYSDKQLLGRVLDPVFGALTALVSVPRSHVSGAELTLAWAPVSGLMIRPSATYVFSRIDGHFVSYDQLGALANFTGEPFPFTPKWQANLTADYTFPIANNLSAFLGVNGVYRSRTNGAFGELAQLAIKGYTVVDLRAGVTDGAGNWSVSLWARNVFDTYYWTSAQRVNDTFTRYAGMPRGFGVSVGYNYR